MGGGDRSFFLEKKQANKTLTTFLLGFMFLHQSTMNACMLQFSSLLPSHIAHTSSSI